MNDHSDVLDVVVPSTLEGERLDRALCLLTGLSRAVATELIGRGNVHLEGRPELRRSTPLHAGARLWVDLTMTQGDRLVPDPSVVFEVCYEDEDLIVVDKPWDLVVHPGAGRHLGTLANGLVARYPELISLGAQEQADPMRPGIVHRLDRGTSGLLVVARSRRALASLQTQMAEHTAQRRYAALVHGLVEHERGIVDAPVGRSSRRPTLMAVSRTGKEARTSYEVVGRYRHPFASTLIVASLETGRTHQVRVHMAAIGHPVVGDTRYQKGPLPPTSLVSGRLFLHAYELGLEHPADGRHLTFRSELPPDLVAVLGAVPTLG